MLTRPSLWTSRCSHVERELSKLRNFVGILVLFVGMAGAGCLTLKLTSEDKSQAKYRIWARMQFGSLPMILFHPVTVGEIQSDAPEFAIYAVHTGNSAALRHQSRPALREECQGPAAMTVWSSALAQPWLSQP